MAKAKYRYNPHTLSYDKIELSFRDKIFRGSMILGASLIIGIGIYFVTDAFVDSPKEKQLKKDNAELLARYSILDKKAEQLAIVLEDIQHRDDNIYRVIFEAEPIASEIREAGFGGVNRYKELENFTNAELIVNASKKLDKLSKQLYIQSKSFDEVFEMAKKKEEMLASLPAIQPVSNEDLTRMASGYGYRTDPVYKTTKFHAGMDFTAPRGTPIYATGDGKVIQADAANRGYGNHVRIKHGYGYITLYAHMSKFNCKVGQKVKRGDVIGYVGNTGKSVGPHCHYEVRKNGNPINPVNFYFNDLTPEQYAKMLELANDPTQSLD
ncbi:MAG: M23 family metallopeptidase [Vicingaceae bacterium]|nr:M23 family metallopeptidase [Vicingaceae bacterium]